MFAHHREDNGQAELHQLSEGRKHHNTACILGPIENGSTRREQVFPRHSNEDHCVADCAARVGSNGGLGDRRYRFLGERGCSRCVGDDGDVGASACEWSRGEKMMYQGSTIILPTSGKIFKCLLSLLALGMALFISTCLIGIVALGLATWLILWMVCQVFVEVLAYANHSDLLTQVLLILVIGFVLLKLYNFLDRRIRAFGA